MSYNNFSKNTQVAIRASQSAHTYFDTNCIKRRGSIERHNAMQTDAYVAIFDAQMDSIMQHEQRKYEHKMKKAA